MNPLPVLACQFFKINYLFTLKNTPFQDSRSNFVVKPGIIIIVMNTDKEISFYLKLTKTRKIYAF